MPPAPDAMAPCGGADGRVNREIDEELNLNQTYEAERSAAAAAMLHEDQKSAYERIMGPVASFLRKGPPQRLFL